MLVDRDDLALAAVESDSLEKAGYRPGPGDDCVRVGPALNLKAVRTAREEVGVERLLAVLISASRVGRPH
jgi:hypothetical protein